MMAIASHHPITDTMSDIVVRSSLVLVVSSAVVVLSEVIVDVVVVCNRIGNVSKLYPVKKLIPKPSVQMYKHICMGGLLAILL